MMQQESDGGVQGNVGDMEGDGVQPEYGVCQPKGEDRQWTVRLVRAPEYDFKENFIDQNNKQCR